MNTKEQILGVVNKLNNSPREFKIKFNKVALSGIIPSKNKSTDAGLDIVSNMKCMILPKTRKVITTGISWEPEGVPENNLVYMKIEGRSGNALKKGFAPLGGVIDQGYRGEIKVIILNNSWFPRFVKVGDKIAQGIVYLIPKFDVAFESEEERGTDGFGSSDKKEKK